MGVGGGGWGKAGLDRGIGGALESPSSYFMKSPPVQYSDNEARRLVEEFIEGDKAGANGGPVPPRAARTKTATAPALRSLRRWCARSPGGAASAPARGRCVGPSRGVLG